MNVTDVNENRKLYQNLEQLTGQVSLLKWNWRSPDGNDTSPLLKSQNLGADEKRFIRIGLSRRTGFEGERAVYKSLVVLDIDRRAKLAWLVDPQQRTFTSIEEGSKWQNTRAIAKLNSVLTGLIEKTAQQEQLERKKSIGQMTKAAKRQRRKQLAKEFNLPPGHEARVQLVKRKVKAERKSAQEPRWEPRGGSTQDLLMRKALYQRLTGVFGDLKTGPDQIVAPGETTGSDSAKDIVFERYQQSETHGLFVLHTAQQGNSGARTMVAAFLVDFVSMQAQATPALELIKSTYTLALRAPEHIREIRAESQLGALLPLGIKDPLAREKAYSETLSMVGVNPAKFQEVPKRFLSTGQRLGLFCNMASDAMLRQLESAGYENIPYQLVGPKRLPQQIVGRDVLREGATEVITVVLPSGEERTLVVSGLKDHERSEDVLRAYLQQQDGNGWEEAYRAQEEQFWDERPKRRASFGRSWD